MTGVQTCALPIWKNVALVTPDIEVNIEALKDYVARMKNYLNYLQELTKQ